MSNWADYAGRVTTFTGRSVHVPTMTAADVCIEDVAHGLSQICRFGGHTTRPYSVAEHSILVMYLAERDHGVGSEIARAALLHDAHEIYVGDMVTPLKMILPSFGVLEHVAEIAVRTAFLLPTPGNARVWDEVRCYDRMAACMEARVLLNPVPTWAEEVPEPYGSYPVPNMSASEAKARFLALYSETF